MTKTCLQAARITTPVHAYVEIDGTGRLTVKALLVESRLPKATERCIRHELLAGTLPYNGGKHLLKFTADSLIDPGD